MLRVIVLVLLVFSVPVSAQVAGTISVFTNRGDLVRNGSFKRWAAEFRSLHPQASVKVVLVERYGEEMAARFDKRDYGDVVLVPTDMPKEAYPKFFLPLNEMGLSNKIYFSDSWSLDGKEYAYTQGVSAEGLIYNKKILNDLDVKSPPDKLSDFYALCEKIKASGKTPIYLNVGAGWPLQQWDKAVMVLAEDGNYYQSMLNQQRPFASGMPYTKSLQIASSIFKKGYSEEEFILDQWQESKVNFAEHNSALFFLGSWAIPQLIESGIPSRHVGFVPFPLDDTGVSKGILNFDWGIAISRYSRNPNTAKAWLDFLLTESNFADVSGFIPTVKTRKSGMPQLSEYMSYKPQVIQTASYDADFLRRANKAGMDFLGGNYIRNILLSPDFDGSMEYLNKRWQQAGSNF
ncbi:ABC transporter substrate-binding protein [Teredinibacter haidensis]|uniref:ABC transporter substrate-binding protein n=1 Tax=Teredinibacter haidensis TaxID=2731755 RepID=UPI000948AD24|nr:ABC transporter substrate-binding protein [Teredinibacter haidensis]